MFAITTELNMVSTPVSWQPLRVAAAARVDVTDLRPSAVGATAPGGHPSPEKLPLDDGPFPILTGPGEAEQFATAHLTEGSNHLEIIIENNGCFGHPLPCLDAATVTALVRAARAHHLLAIAHTSTHDGTELTLQAGIDGLAHISTAPMGQATTIPSPRRTCTGKQRWHQMKKTILRLRHTYRMIRVERAECAARSMVGSVRGWRAGQASWTTRPCGRAAPQVGSRRT